MKQSNIFSFYSGSYHPTNKKLRSRKATKLRRKAEANDTSEAKQQQKLKRKVYNIQYGHAVPKNWKDIICLDTLNGNRKWRDAVAKEVVALLELGCFQVSQLQTSK